MAEKYSELEVAPNERLPEVVDQAAHAPERDLSGDSPELDKTSWPLHVSCIAHLSPQRTKSSNDQAFQNLSPTSQTPAYTPSRPDFKDRSDSAPEHGSPDPNYDSNKDRETMKEAGSPPPPRTPLAGIDAHPEVASHREELTRSQKRRGLGLWIIIGLVAFLVIAIALGVGLGVGLTRHKNSKSSSRCGSFFDGVLEFLLTLSVSPLQRQTLRRMRRYLMRYIMILRYQSWHWGMVTSGCFFKREVATFGKLFSPNRRDCGRVISTML